MKTALITGVSGQDGSLLAELLLTKKYKVTAISNHPLSSDDPRFQNYKEFYKSITWTQQGLEDTNKLNEFLKDNPPDEVYHLGAQSFSSTGFENTLAPFQSNVEGTYNLLSSVFKQNPSAKFFFAGSSEIFGDNAKNTMNESERFFPKTMYGLSKLLGHELIRNYRENLNKFTVTGFLFNHESHRRGEEFVTRKITLAAARIKLGLQKKLVLGSLDSKRDWSAAEDFIEGFHLALQTKEAKDYVFSSGKLHTVEEFVQKSFSVLGLNYQDFILIDPSLNRTSRFDLVGDPTRAKTELNWTPKYTFEQIIEKMVRSDFDLVSKSK